MRGGSIFVTVLLIVWPVCQRMPTSGDGINIVDSGSGDQWTLRFEDAARHPSNNPVEASPERKLLADDSPPSMEFVLVRGPQKISRVKWNTAVSRALSRRNRVPVKSSRSAKSKNDFRLGSLNMISAYEELLSEYQEDQKEKMELQLLQGWQRKMVQPRRTVKSFADLIIVPPPPEEGILLGGYVLEPVTEDDLNMAVYQPKAFYELEEPGNKERMELLAGKQHKMLNSLDDEALHALNKGAGVLGQLVDQVTGTAGGMSEAVKKVGQEALAVAASRAPEESAGYVNLRTGLPCIPSPDHIYCVATPTTTTTKAPPSLVELLKYRKKKEEEEEKRRRVELAIHLEQQKRQHNPYDQPVYFEAAESQLMKPTDVFKKKMFVHREKAGKEEEHLASFSSMQEAQTVLKFAKHATHKREDEPSFSRDSESETPLPASALNAASRRARGSSKALPEQPQTGVIQDARHASRHYGKAIVEEVIRPRQLKDFSVRSDKAWPLSPREPTRLLNTILNAEQISLEEAFSVAPSRQDRASRRKKADSRWSTRQSDIVIDPIPSLRVLRKSNLATPLHLFRSRSAEPLTSHSSDKQSVQKVESQGDGGSFADVTSLEETPARKTRKSDGIQPGFSSVPLTGSSDGDAQENLPGTAPADEHNKGGSVIVEGARRFQSHIQSATLTPQQLAKYTRGNKPSSLASNEDLIKTEKERAKRERQEQRLSRLTDNFTAMSYAEELHNAALATGDPLPSDAVVGPFLRVSSLPPILREKVERTQQHKERRREEKDARQERKREEWQATKNNARLQQLENNLSDRTLAFITGYLNSDTPSSINKASECGSKVKCTRGSPAAKDQSLKPFDVTIDTNKSTEDTLRQASPRVKGFSEVANQRSGINTHSVEEESNAGKRSRHTESSWSPLTKTDQSILLDELHLARVVWLDGEDNENPFQIHPRVSRISRNIDTSFF
ncbi:hypothetical protein TGGT1_225400 [Toxoplasma gondii GT1]|uniref:Uncharacterized protein n=5 Tax=Toxoplasma gondii TaxID=5811 RepID=S7UX53_TOXGG|nr:hypothetical protein TGGT1_225400 [Toxoplasma gondii GT1]KAF4640585.1 hypothetical protein TGRH88_045110 [Toxoplasma gondii]KFG55106.1 hypothetical protein TGFOU_225400 [Toxoplasma gondii FOU]PUA91235.1 hypothetical protein TGBR9_225400 [Toxoplasma gondii TgCATBr9]RQX74593.1 hypothetical protein TGCAST_225400 [Toxoplasma gondii CAST]